MSVLVSNGAAERSSAAPVLQPGSEFEQPRASILTFWHLLSLDAPTVAVLWTVFIATLTDTRLPVSLPIAMGVGVWMIYASDRLLDSKPLRSSQRTRHHDNLEPRHFFHHRHRAAFAKMLVISGAALSFLLPRLPAPAMHLYFAEGFMLAAYFLLIHAGPSLSASTRRLPKELLLGPFFSAATFIPVVSRKTGLRPELLPLAVLFAALCSLNCLYIYAWEHHANSDPDWTATYLAANLGVISFLFLTASLLCFLACGRMAHLPTGLRPYPLACAGSGCLLMAIHALRRYFSPLALRTAADAALLTPLAVLPFLGRSLT